MIFRIKYEEFLDRIERINRIRYEDLRGVAIKINKTEPAPAYSSSPNILLSPYNKEPTDGNQVRVGVYSNGK